MKNGPDSVVQVGAFEAKTHLARLLDRVEEGEVILITRHGKVVAKLAPATLDASRERAVAAAERMLARSKGMRLEGLTWRELRDEGRKR